MIRASVQVAGGFQPTVSLGSGSSPAGASLKEYNVVDYGALGLGNAAADTQGILAAIAAAEVGKGTVVFPPPPSGDYLLTQSMILAVDSTVSLRGTGGKVSIKASGAPFGPMLQITSTPNAFGSRYGVVRDLSFNGNQIATTGLSVWAIQRTFLNVDVRGCTQRGLYLPSSQNCTFISCNFENNGSVGALDANVDIDLGAGNNQFFRCELSATAGVQGVAYNLLIRQSAASPAGVFAQPERNGFYGCVIERSATNQLGAILQRAGRLNTLIDTDVNTAGARNAVTVNRADGVTSNLLVLDSCHFSGDLATSIAFDLSTTDAPAVKMLETFLENFAVGFKVGDSTNAEVEPPIDTGSVTTFVQATGASTIGRLVTQRLLKIPGPPSSTSGAPPGLANLIAQLYDSLNNMMWAYNGAWRQAFCSIGTVSPAWPNTGGTITPDFSQTDHLQVVNPNGHGADNITIATPTNLASFGRTYCIDLYNNSGGVWTGTVTFGAGWKLAGAVTLPGNGNHRLYVFRIDPFASDFHEESRSVADVVH